MSTAHILLSSCVFAASARPPHTSVGMLLRVLGAGLSLLRPQGARLSVAGRPGVLSERTNIFYKGHMNESDYTHMHKHCHTLSLLRCMQPAQLLSW